MGKFFGVECEGKFLMEKRTNIPAWDASQEGRLFYNISNATPYFGGPSQFESFRTVADAIPAGEIILFEKNSSVFGYNLQDDVDDEVVYISKGSNEGGETGGTSIGSWTQPNHDHTFNGDSHRHTISHTHTVFRDGWGTSGPPPGDPPTVFGRICVGSGLSEINEALESLRMAGNNTTTSGVSVSNSGYTTQGGTVLESATTPSWRPKSRVFTRQQRI